MMCEWGNTLSLEVTVPAYLSSNGQEKRKTVGIDRCIHPIVKALNKGGIYTVASCCGHGKIVGDIALGDGRELIIAKDFDEARRLLKLIGKHQ